MKEYKKYYSKYRNLKQINIEQIKNELDENFKIEPGYKATFAIGDLHGNALKAIRFLIEIGVIDLHQHGLQSIYDRLKSAYNSKNYYSFERNLEEIRFDTSRIKQIKLVFIGGILADIGNSDYMTLLVFQRMKESKIDYTICLSNHDEKFLDLLNKKIKPQFLYKSYDLDSILHYEDTFLENYATAYLPHLKVMEYETIGIKEIVYSHAPCNLETIKEITFAPKGANLHATITKINNYFHDFVINSNQSFTSMWILTTHLHNFVRGIKNTKFPDHNVINVFGHIGNNDTNNQNQVNLYSNFGKDNDPPTGDLKIYSVYKYQTSENSIHHDLYVKEMNELFDDLYVKEMNELFDDLFERRDASKSSSKTSFKAEASDQNYVTCKKRNSIIDIKEIRINILRILEKYLKTNPNNTSKSRNIWLYLKGKNHIGRLEQVYDAIEKSTNINEMRSILQQQKDIFETAMSYSKTKVKGSISERWNKNEVHTWVKNIPKNLNKSEFYKTIDSALKYVNIKLQKASGPRYNSPRASFNHLASPHFNSNSNFFTPLRNVNNTCYINSSLQLLDHINESPNNVFNFPSFSSRDSLNSLVSAFWLPEGQLLNENYSQQDAYDFLSSIMSNSEYRNVCLNNFQILFTITKKLHCTKHKEIEETRITNDEIYIYDLDFIKDTHSTTHCISDMLVRQQSPQKSDVPLICYSCLAEKYGQKENYTLLEENNYKFPGEHSTKISNNPNFFIIRLKRFQWDGYNNYSKNISEIEVDINLNIANKQYKLLAYIIHKGKTSKQGHYYLVSLKKYPKVYKINDEEVKILKENEETELRKQAYIMLYKKI
ncbi:ubiquitin C-terminal hydrolase [Allofrancisella inopinata]|uniref:USP domain-containing protein n=1 Tax=Allofrancisella inopinata TaxID=1085647 RepID=A0AAE7CQ74_9GAMM|nr:ubiquitin carboxyl-terminal hydrolase family protein [Allofrancisella inopinata]QIV95566.1 hypothetical protein E4K63_01420 [Allofrancisella inopinata]TDT69937.1 ubiquitin C-terminal hydrolase [Allofrancisella inopinata]